MKLTREVRFYAGGRARATGNGHGDDSGDRADRPTNSWAGTSAAVGGGRYLALRATVEGEIDARSGYVCNIADVDRVLRRVAVPRFDTCSFVPRETARLLATLKDEVASALPGHVALAGLGLSLSPFTRIAVTAREEAMVSLTQSFEFSASHRLYCASMSEEENRRLFGKCANANGHGHNYVLEVTLRGVPDEADDQSGASPPTLIEVVHLDEIVEREIIARFDHKHLNLDCPEFADLNPSVENIARVIWRLLAGKVGPAEMASVRVWETGKTCAEFSGV